MRRLKWLLPVIIGVALVGCAQSTPTTTSEPPAGTLQTPLSGVVQVTMQNFAYHPTLLVVKKGTVLQVTNQDVAGHTLTADDGSFDTPVLAHGKTASITLDKVGVFKFHCTPHPTRLLGQVTVVE